MATLSRIKAGDTLYDVKRASRMNRVFWKEKYDIWPVYVEEVDLEGNRALISWNGNPARWVAAERLERYRVKPPKE